MRSYRRAHPRTCPRAAAEVTRDLDLETSVWSGGQGLGSAGLVSGRKYVYAEADCAARRAWVAHAHAGPTRRCSAFPSSPCAEAGR